MKIQKVLPLSAILVVFAALPSFAGSSYVENSYNLKNIYNGKSSTNVKVDEIYKGYRSAGSDAVKKGKSSTRVSYYEKGDVTLENGDVVWRDTYFSEKDNFKITASSWSRESGAFAKTTDVDVKESYNFTGFDKTHRTTSGFDF